MEINFAIRFNLIKCGVSDADNPKLLSIIYDLPEKDISEQINYSRELVRSEAEKLSAFGNAECLKGKKILFVGDSLSSDRLSFTNILSEAIPTEFVNAAVSGSSTAGFVGGLEYILKEHKPDLVHVLLGTNDVPQVGEKGRRNIVTKEEYKNNISYILRCISDYNAKAVISTIPHVNQEVCDKAFLPGKKIDNNVIDEYNEIIFSVAQNAVVNDISSILEPLNDENLFEPDGVHLSFKAHKAVAKELYKKLIKTGMGK